MAIVFKTIVTVQLCTYTPMLCKWFECVGWHVSCFVFQTSFCFFRNVIGNGLFVSESIICPHPILKTCFCDKMELSGDNFSGSVLASWLKVWCSPSVNWCDSSHHWWCLLCVTVCECVVVAMVILDTPLSHMVVSMITTSTLASREVAMA